MRWLLALALASASACGGDTATIVRDGAVIAEFDVELALTAEERARGLRGADPLCGDCGLLIELPRASEVCIDNRDVSFDIDAIVVDEAGSVFAIERMIPADDATSRCHPATAVVLEVSGGAASDVLIGDSLER